MAVGYNHLHAKNHIFLQEYGFDKFYKNDAVLKGLLRPPPHHTPSPPSSSSSSLFYANNRITPLPTKSHSEKVSPSFPSLQPTGSTGFSWSYDSRSRTTWSKPTKIFRDFSYILNLLYKNQGKFFLECIIFLREKKG